MKRSTKPMKRTPIKRVSDKRKAELAIYSREKKTAFKALADAQGLTSGKPLCERCMSTPELFKTARRAVDWHHWWPRGRGGRFLGGKMFCVCRVCHDWIHSNDDAAREGGWIK